MQLKRTSAPGLLKKAAPYAALTGTFVVACAASGFSAFADEGDTLALGRFICEGVLPYRDVFSHHFPLSYYLSALLFLLVGPSIVAHRLAIITLQLMAWITAMALSRRPVTVGLAGTVWFLVAPFCAGHMALYPVFAGTALLIAFSAVLAVLTGSARTGLYTGVVVGAALAAAVLCDPTMVPAAIVLSVAVLWRHHHRPIAAGLTLAATLLLSGACLALLATGSLRAFWRDGVLFNLETYRDYGTLASRPLVSVLGLNPSEGFPFGLNFAVPLAEAAPGEPLFDRSVFTSTFYRLCLLFGPLILTWRNHRFAAGVTATTALMLLATGHDFGFHAIPMVMIALTVAAWVLLPDPATTHTGSEAWRPLVPRIALGALAMGLLIQVAGAYLRHSDRYFGREYVDAVHRRAATYSHLPVELPRDVELAAFPEGTYDHFLTGLRPATRFMFYWPWIMDIGEAEVVDRLRRGRLVVRLDERLPTVAGADLARRYSGIRSLLDRLMHRVDSTVWISRDLLPSPRNPAIVDGRPVEVPTQRQDSTQPR